MDTDGNPLMIRRFILVLALLATGIAMAQTDLSRAGAEDPFGRFLPIERAFQVGAVALDANTIGIVWRVAPEYYLYEHRFSVTASDGTTLGALQIPPGITHTDEFFGTVQIHRGQVEIRVAVLRTDTGPVEIPLVLGYQGCADAGLCYPPDERMVTVSMPAVGSVPDAPVWVSEQDRLAGLLEGGQLWLVILTFYGLGLLLTFTPCVLPMVPILSGIIIGQGPGLSAGRGFLLSLIYVLAMAATYTAAGVAAALLGHNLQAIFQQPGVLIAFAAVFALLATAMFGWWQFQMPAAIQTRLTALANRQRAGSFGGVAVMGVLSALIVGPCVAAPLAGALIYIGRTGDAVLGGVALFALSMGMGTLLLALGASAGKLMPRIGPWMNTVRALFGVLMLGVAIWLLERVMPTPVTLVLWSVLAFGSAVAMAVSSSTNKLWRVTAVALLLWGSALIIGAATGGRDPLNPLRDSTLFGANDATTEIAHLPFRRIASLAELEVELAQASANGQAVMLDFYADWCVACKQMERDTFADDRVRMALDSVVLLQADVTAYNDADRELMRTLQVIGPPSILFFGTDGMEASRYRVVGYMPAEAFANLINEAVSQ